MNRAERLASLRVPAKVHSFSGYDADHQVWVGGVRLAFDADRVAEAWRSSITCGAVCKDETEWRAFIREVCVALDVSTVPSDADFRTPGIPYLEKLIGSDVTALYSDHPFGKLEGIEGPTGKRFTIRGFQKRHYPNHAPTPADTRFKEIVDEINHHTRGLAEWTRKLAEFEKTKRDLVDWSVEP